MTADPIENFQKVLHSLADFGVVLVSDRAFPNVASMVSGEEVRGSWWSHPLAHTIFSVNEMLEDHKDVLLTKLIDGKVTFVHRSIWQQLYAVATAREEWQLQDLSTAAKTLLKKVDERVILNTNDLGPIGGTKPGDIARELELRLLIHTDQVHTDSGAHAKRLETWESWAKRVGLKTRNRDPGAAKRFLEQRVAHINKEFGAKSRLSWQFLSGVNTPNSS